MNGVEMYSGNSSVGSSSSDSSRGTCRKTRFRTVHLKRTGVAPGSSTFGFSFRGGREFGTGFFVSVVEPGSEAHQKGVKVGDQILRINGLSVENATHQEILLLAQHHHHLTLSLKNVGLIPVKDNCDDPLTWKLVDEPLDAALFTGGCDVDRIVIDAPDGSKLGCGICKGPDWRPGIFVQYTKPASLARQCGLQPGDQILQCNRVSFTNIDFSYAVSVLKGQGTLDLIVRKGSGIDLFPGESSGYSSASSTTDEVISHHRGAKRNSESTNHTENRTSYIDSTNYIENRRNVELNNYTDRKYNGEINNYIEPRRINGELNSFADRRSNGEINNYIEPRRINGELNSFTDRRSNGETNNYVAHRRSGELCNEDYSSPRNKRNSSVDRKRGPPPPPPVPGSVPRPPPLKSASSVDSLLDSVRSPSRRNESSLHETPSPLVTFRQECRYGSQTVVQISSGGRGSGPMQVEVHRAPAPALPVASLEKSASISSFSSSASLSSAISQELQRRKERKNMNGGEEVVERSPRKPLDGQTREHDDLIAELKRRQDNRLAKTQNASSSPDIRIPSPDSLDSPPPCPTPDYSDISENQSPQPVHTVKSSILRFEERTRKVHAPKSVTFGATSAKEITPRKMEITQNGSESTPIVPSTLEPSKISQAMEPLDIVEMHSIDTQELCQPKKQAPKPPQTYFVSAPRKDLNDSTKRTTIIQITEYANDDTKSPGKFDFLEDKNKNNRETFDNELAKTLSRISVRNQSDGQDTKDCISQTIDRGVGKPYVHNYVPIQNINQEELSSVKKTLKTFEKNSGTNTIIVQIPKRN